MVTYSSRYLLHRWFQACIILAHTVGPSVFRGSHRKFRATFHERRAIDQSDKKARKSAVSCGVRFGNKRDRGKSVNFSDSAYEDIRGKTQTGPLTREISEVIRLVLKRTHKTSIFVISVKRANYRRVPCHFLTEPSEEYSAVADRWQRYRQGEVLRRQDGSCENYNDARTRLSLTRGAPIIQSRSIFP